MAENIYQVIASGWDGNSETCLLGHIRTFTRLELHEYIAHIAKGIMKKNKSYFGDIIHILEDELIANHGFYKIARTFAMFDEFATSKGIDKELAFMRKIQ